MLCSNPPGKQLVHNPKTDQTSLFWGFTKIKKTCHCSFQWRIQDLSRIWNRTSSAKMLTYLHPMSKWWVSCNLLYLTHYTACEVQQISKFKLMTPTMVIQNATIVHIPTYTIHEKTFYNQAKKTDTKFYNGIGTIKARVTYTDHISYVICIPALN